MVSADGRWSDGYEPFRDQASGIEGPGRHRRHRSRSWDAARGVTSRLKGQDTRLTKAEFGARADRICLEASSHFDELPEPVGGAKPVGLGGFMRKWVVKLRVLQPPARIADDWRAGLDLLDRAADRLDDAEAGDPEAQGEALWSLEAQAQKHFDAMQVPFGVCFVE